MARRGRPPTLSRERVRATAVELADRGGTSALTMRSLAAELGVEAMSLYHHVANKEALLDGLVEILMVEVDTATSAASASASGTVGDPAAAGDWRTGVRRRCLAAREVMERHPWGPEVIGSRAEIPPSVFSHFEAVLAAMVEAGVSYHLGHRALHALGSMVLGFVQELFSPATDADELTEEQVAMMTAAFPHTSAMVAAELHAADDPVLGWCDSRAEFEFTLDLLLDGLEAKRVASLPAATT